MGTLATMGQPRLDTTQYDLIYNLTSLGLASMGASTVFFFLRIPSFTERYRAALCFTGLVTFIAMCHYFRIFQSFESAYTPCRVTSNTCDANGHNCTGSTIAIAPATTMATRQLATASTMLTAMSTGFSPSHSS